MNDLSANDPNNIFLIDHAWTFRLNSARLALQEVAGLKERLLESFGMKVEDLLNPDDTGSDYVGSESGDIATRPRASGSSKNDDENDSDHSSASSSIGEVDVKIINALLAKLPQFMNTYTIKLRNGVLNETDMPGKNLLDGVFYSRFSMVRYGRIWMSHPALEWTQHSCDSFLLYVRKGCLQYSVSIKGHQS